MNKPSAWSRRFAALLAAAVLSAGVPHEAWALTARAVAVPARAGAPANAAAVPVKRAAPSLRAGPALLLPKAGASALLAPLQAPSAAASASILAPIAAGGAETRRAGAPRRGYEDRRPAGLLPSAGLTSAGASARPAGRASALASVRGAELEAAFKGRSAETLAAGALSSGRAALAPASSDATPPSEPTPPAPNDPKKSEGLGPVAKWFINALLIAQIGVESLAVAMPALTKKIFNDPTIMAEIGIFSAIAGVTGRQFAPIVIRKLGLRKTYLAGTGFRLASITAIITLLATGTMTLPLMMLFYSVNGFIGGITGTAEASIPPAIVGQSQAKIEHFWTVEQTLLEIVGVTVPIVAGALVGSLGFVPILSVFPVTFGVALGILFLKLKIAKADDGREEQAAGSDEGPKGVKAVFADFFHKIAEGARLVWKDARLKYAFLAYTFYTLLNPFLYSVIGPMYALLLVGEDKMSGVYGLLTGLYSLGGLLGGVLMILEKRRLDKLKASNRIDKTGIEEQLRKSMLKWMLWGIAGISAFLTFPITAAPLIGSLTIPALALIPFGVAQVVATLKLRSYFQATAPKEKMPAAMGFFGSASLAISTAGLLGLKYLFTGLAGFTPFYIISAAMLPLGAYYLYLQRKLAKASAPGDKK